MKRLFLTAFRQHKHRFLICFIFIAMIFLTIASQLEIFALGVISKRGLAEGGQAEGLVTKGINFLSNIFPIAENITYLAIFIICVALFKAITLFAHRYATRLIAIRVSCDLRQDYFEHIQSLPMSFYQQHNIGTLTARVMGDAALIAEAINACLVNYIQTPFVIGSTLFLCFMASWQLSLIVFLGFPLIIFPIMFLARRVKKVSKQIQHNQEIFASTLVDFLSGILTVKVFAMENFSLKKYREGNERMAALEQKSARYDLATRPIVHTIGMTFLAGILLYGLYILNMTVADVLVYGGFLYLFYEPVKKFAEENTHIQRGVAAAERMYEVMALNPQIEDTSNAITLTKFEKEIEFDNVWFGYGDQYILKGLSFKVSKGETLAIVGPTGAGKSTIIQLLPRLYDIQKGEIRIDGKPLKSFTQNSLREMIAVVPQKAFLFLDTVAQNIAFGRPFKEDQIQAAARRAYADEFIVQLPKAYQTELAEGGKNLSGGQQQRLTIARALFKNAPILIMDEATSALDASSEQHIKSTIREVRGTLTQIIIAHRLSTIEDADRILYLEKGEKIAEGTKEELLQTCEGFRRMWQAQQLKKEA